MKRILLTLTVIFVGIGAALAQTTLKGKVVEDASGLTVPFATVALYKNGVLITGTDTDVDGNYFFSNIDPGTYDVEAAYLSFATSRITDVLVKADKETSLDFRLVEEGELIDVVVVTGYKVALIDTDETTQGGVITSEAIKSLPTKNIDALAATTAGLSTVNGNDVSVRGSRSDATYYYVDGVRVSSSAAKNMVVQSDIDQLQVVTGGIEAKYGDVTGGIISITTKGPSQNFTGGIELETSEFLDAYGYNLASANLSGPILKNKDDQSILGFRVAGQYRLIADDNPSYYGVYRMSEDSIKSLEADPLYTIGETYFPRAGTYKQDALPETQKASPNEELEDWNVSGKIDVRFNDNIDMSFSGGVFDSKDRFTPFSRSSRNTTFGRAGFWGLMNWTNNPYYNTNGYRANVRLRHKLGKQSYGSGEETTQGVIRNAYYTLQFGLEKTKRNTEDVRHGDDLFSYGYYGTFGKEWLTRASLVQGEDAIPGQVSIGFNPFSQDSIYFAHQGFTEIESEFVPDNTINPALATMASLAQVKQNGFNTAAFRDVWDLYNNVGQVYNMYFKSERDRYTLNVASGFDLFPGSSDDGKHSIQFGFTYEQQVNRSYSLRPEQLWRIARQAANRQIAGIDTNKVVGTFTQTVNGQEYTFEEFDKLVDEDNVSDLYFYKRFRDKFNIPLNEFVNIDQYGPNDLSLDMFSPRELILDNRINLNYYGYNYVGEKTSTTTTFDDFFKDEDENGVRKFEVAPLQPIYAAGYLQDKFSFKDIIFRAGVRVDYYDANTKVLKDQFSLYDIQTADEFHAINSEFEKAPGIGDDYKVYVQSAENNEPFAYRKDNEWFTTTGEIINNPSSFFSGTVITPARKNPLNDISEKTFNIDDSFTDFEPQFNVMPRLAFSFPISEDAGFFAHYDVLVQRPPANTDATPLNYYYFTSDPVRFATTFGPASNPNLKPEKTIDYEVGFQQKVTNTSAIKFSAYYKELRDMIQRVVLRNVADINQYETYGNIDFGTVKGFAVSYDLRRTGNIQMKVNYTLQFANGTGSDANSAQGLSNVGVIRELFPFSYDERHRVNVTLDYTYADGKAYNGPTIGGKQIFANAGANIILAAVSGRPYSLYSQVRDPYTESNIQNINGSRLPWIFNCDMRLSKQFAFSLGTESDRNLNANVYLRFENLFNTRNVINVYNVTQDPEDDGFLNTQFGADRLQAYASSGRDIDAYLASYQWRLLNPNHFAAPRRIYLGAIFDF